MKDRKTTEAKRRAIAKYDAANARRVGLKFILTTDADIIEKLDSVPNKQAYIKQLIREDLKKHPVKKEKIMKNYELYIRYKNGEVDEYYTRMTGGIGWPSEAETPEQVLQEMKDYDELGTFESIDENENIDSYWVEEIQPED